MTSKTISSSQSSGITLTAGNYGTYDPLTITSAGAIGSAGGSAIYSAAALAWSISNAGSLTSTKTGAGFGGVILKAGGTVGNLSGGLIAGVAYGAYLAGSAGGTITNSGTIKATGATGIGVQIKAANATLINGGTIAASAASRTAISLLGSNDVLVLDPGFAITGKVTAQSSDVLRLRAGAATGTLAGLGGNVAGFGSTTIDAGAAWTLTGTITTGLTNSGTLNVKSTLHFANATIANGGVMQGGQLNLYDGGDTLTNNGTINGTTAATSAAVGVINGVVVNNATIASTSTNRFSAGVFIQGGTLSNASGGQIIGATGVYDVKYGQATVINAGTIKGTVTVAYGAVALRDGGSVTNLSGGLLSGCFGVFIQNNAGFVSNQGSISGTKYYGVLLSNGGTISNLAGGRITGFGGVQVGVTTAATLINTGTVIGTRYYGAEVAVGGGLVINTNTGTNAGYIAGKYAGIRFVGGGTDTVNNTGTIKATGAGTGPLSSGIYLRQTSGTITNGTSGGASGLIQGARYGIEAIDQPLLLTNYGTILGTVGVLAADVTAPSNNTVINAGTIKSSLGTAGAAILFTGGDDRVVIDPGAVFIGIVDGGTGNNTLELAGTSAASLYGLGTSFTNFGTIVVDAGAQWTLSGSATMTAGSVIDFASNAGMLRFDPANVAATINGFATGDTITLAGIADATSIGVVNSHTVEVTRSGNPAIDLAFDPAQDLTQATFHVTEQGGNAVITADSLACFAEGTGIATPGGRVAVEMLREGDLVRTVSGGVRPVRWIGFRRIDPRRHSAPERAQPIRVLANAFAKGAPCRDLRLSPDHAVFMDGMLVPIRLLRNDSSIVRETACRAVTYYHVELDAHDVLLAEGLAAESYLDTGNRDMFENAGMPLLLHPLFGNDQALRERASCAPFAGVAQVKRLWGRLAVRAMGLRLPLPATENTADPAVRIVLGERVVRPERVDGDRFGFVLPAGARDARLVSRSAMPCEDRPWIEDRRRLGVMVSRMTLRIGTMVASIGLDHKLLGDGWWDIESDGHSTWRWTNGDAMLPLPGAQGATLLEVELAGMGAYRVGQTVVAPTPAAGPARTGPERRRALPERSRGHAGKLPDPPADPPANPPGRRGRGRGFECQPHGQSHVSISPLYRPDDTNSRP